MKPVAIIGAGITGLTAAFYLKRKGIPVTVYESGGRVGGVIQSIRQDGYLAESGPNTLIDTSRLVADAGLASRRLDANPAVRTRFIVRNRRPIVLPGSPMGDSRLLSFRGILAVLREPFVPRRRNGPEESIAQFVVRRFNQEFLDRAFDAVVAGIYAGDPHKLSMTHAFPKMKALEDNHGSVLKGQFFGARARKKRGEIPGNRAPAFSFDEGLQVLPDTLAADLGDAVRLRTSVSALTQTTEGWTLHLKSADGESQAQHSAIIFCGTAYKLAELRVNLLPATGSLDLSPFSEIRHPPIASVVLGFRREDVAHPCQGFGMLIPKIEGFNILGTIFSSSLFPNRAPAGHLTLATYIGGERQPELASLPAEKLYDLTCEDLRVLLGVKGQPTFRHCVYYPRAIPQYNVGYGRYRDLMTEIETKAPGFFLAGHYRDGISLSNSIASGCNVVERIEKHLASSQAERA